MFLEKAKDFPLPPPDFKPLSVPLGPVRALMLFATKSIFVTKSKVGEASRIVRANSGDMSSEEELLQFEALVPSFSLKPDFHGPIRSREEFCIAFVFCSSSSNYSSTHFLLHASHATELLFCQVKHCTVPEERTLNSKI